jgi:small nuclear ribonucleoprotein
MAYNNSRNPLRALQKRIGENVGIRLKDGTEYYGKLKEYDNFMNIIITDTEERVKKEVTGTYKQLFIRGNNILFVLPDPQ